MTTWIAQYSEILWWLAATSAITFTLSILGIPLLVVRIPVDYFARDQRGQTRWSNHHPIIRVVLLGLKNLLGILLLVAGILMLFLPGQGLLTMAIGLMLLDFPGKHEAERWMISRPPVLGTINWIRRKAQVPPLHM